MSTRTIRNVTFFGLALTFAIGYYQQTVMADSDPTEICESLGCSSYSTVCTTGDDLNYAGCNGCNPDMFPTYCELDFGGTGTCGGNRCFCMVDDNPDCGIPD